MIFAYIEARLREKSTWAGIVAAISGGALLSAPYSYAVIAAGILGVLAPTS